jgi:tetratricopeptide (TPR) repeat protein
LIDVSYEIKKFRPINIAAIPADEKYGENVRLAFALYNKAIQKIKDGYEDLARIDLKKAIQLFPSFHVAIILLGMCTFANGDRIGAVRIFNSVKDSVMREKALNYLDYLANEMDSIDNRDVVRPEITEEEMFEFETSTSTDKQTFKKFEVIEVEDTMENLKDLKIEPVVEEEIREKKVEEVVEENEEDDEIEEKIVNFAEVEKKANVKQEIITEEKRKEKTAAKTIKNARMYYFVAGYVICAALIFAVFMYAMSTNSENKELRDTLAKYTGTNATESTPTPEPTQPPSTATPTPTEVPIDHYAETKKLVRECVKHYNFKQYFNVVELYHTIKMQYVPESDLENLKNIYEFSLNQFTKQNHDSIFSLSSQGKHEEVIEMLLPIQKYNPNYSRIDSVIFYIGKAYEDSKNYAKAKEYYTEIVDKYPDSSYYSWASYRLKVIG